MHIAVFFLILSAASSVVNAAPKNCQPKQFTPIPSLHKLNYHEARSKLIASGWFPIQTKQRGVIPDNDPDISTGNGRLFWERGYLEVESCAASGLSNCAFRWADKYGNHARVFTQGEENPKAKAYAMGSGGEFVCQGQE